MSNLIQVTVPDIGDYKNIPVIEILVAAGDTVSAEDPLVTLESDKATMEVPAPVAGVIKELKVKVGDKVSEGTLVMTLEASAATAAPAKETAKPAPAPVAAVPVKAAAPAPASIPAVRLELPRDELYDRINRRVTAMLDAGWLDEARRLRDLPHPLSREARQAVGYRELLEHLETGRAWDETVTLIRTHTRQLAKRQTTWFRHMPACVAIDARAADRADRVLKAWRVLS